jgi:hypothetical protein
MALLELSRPLQHHDVEKVEAREEAFQRSFLGRPPDDRAKSEAEEKGPGEREHSAYSAQKCPTEADDHSSTLSRGLECLTSPPETVLAARNAVAVYRGDEQVESLSETFGDFRTAVVELECSASLSCSLTEDEVKAITKAAGKKVAELAPLLGAFVEPALAPIARPAWFHHAPGAAQPTAEPREGKAA